MCAAAEKNGKEVYRKKFILCGQSKNKYIIFKSLAVQFFTNHWSVHLKIFPGYI